MTLPVLEHICQRYPPTPKGPGAASPASAATPHGDSSR